MHDQTAKFYQILHFIAIQQSLDYKKAEKELMLSVKTTRSFITSNSTFQGKEKSYYRRYNWLYIMVIPASIFVAIGFYYMFGFRNYSATFFVSMILMVGFTMLTDSYERKNSLLILRKENLELHGKKFNWDQIEEIYIYQQTSYLQRIPLYYMVILSKSGNMFMRELPRSYSISKLSSTVELFRNKR